MRTSFLFFSLFFTLAASAQKDGIYRDLDLALSEPEKVLTLDLSGNGLTELPVDVQKLSKLEGLFLRNNNLRELPPFLGNCKSLQRICVDNNPQFNLSASLKNIIGLELLYFSAANCRIVAIPVSIENQKNLASLILQGNLITAVPQHLGTLTQLKTLDLSDNKIQSVSPFIWNCSGLSYLDLTGNAQVGSDSALSALIALPNLETLKLSTTGTVHVLQEIRTKSLEIENTSLDEHFPVENLNAQTLVLKNVNFTDQADFFNRLSQNPNVDRLIIEFCPLQNKLNGLEKCRGLESIELRNTGLSGTEELKKLVQLKMLKIYGERINDQQLTDLKAALPQTSIQADVQGVYPFKAGPLPGIEVPAITRVFDAQSTNVLETGNVKITFPANAFVDAKGNIVTGNVQVNYREFFDPVSIAASGINMRLDTSGAGSYMASAGMFEIYATKNGDTLYPNQKAGIKAQINSVQEGDGFKLYATGGHQNWKVDSDVIHFNPVYKVPQPYLALPKMYIEKIKFNLNGNTNNFTISIRAYDEDDYNYTYRKSPAFVSYPELRTLKKYVFSYQGDNGRYHYKQLDSINRQIIGTARWVNYTYRLPALIEDLSFEPDFNKDYIVMRFKFKGKKYEIPIAIQENNLSNAKIQAKNKEFFTAMKKYRFENGKRQTALDYYSREFYNYQNQLLKNRAATDSMLLADQHLLGLRDSMMETMGLRKARALRQYNTIFNLGGFGPINIDKEINVENNSVSPLMVRYETEGIEVNPNILLLVNQSNNSCLSYTGNQQVLIEKRKKYAVIAVLDNSHIGVCDSEAFELGKMKGTIYLKKLNTNSTSIDDLRAEL